MKPNLKTIIGRLIPVLVIAGIIFYSSAQPYSKQNIQPMLGEWFVLPEGVVSILSKVHFTYAGSPVSVEERGVEGFIEFFIRKGAHFGVFLLLAVSAARLFRLWVKSHARLLLATAAFIFLYACSDEWHQSFTGERTPLFHDVMIDFVGGVTGVLIYLMWRMRKERNERKDTTI